MRIKTTLVLPILALIITGCATTPKYNSEPIKVFDANISKYWSYNSRINKRRYLMGSNKGCYRIVPKNQNLDFEVIMTAEVALTIDSTGRTFDHKLVVGTGNVHIDNNLLDMSSDIKWIPSEQNSGLQPVKYNEKYNLVSDLATCTPPENSNIFIGLSSKELIYQINLY